MTTFRAPLLVALVALLFAAACDRTNGSISPAGQSPAGALPPDTELAKCAAEFLSERTDMRVGATYGDDAAQWRVTSWNDWVPGESPQITRGPDRYDIVTFRLTNVPGELAMHSRVLRNIQAASDAGVSIKFAVTAAPPGQDVATLSFAIGTRQDGTVVPVGICNVRLLNFQAFVAHETATRKSTPIEVIKGLEAGETSQEFSDLENFKRGDDQGSSGTNSL